MRYLFGLFLIVAIALFACQQESDTPEMLIGTWRIDSFKVQTMLMPDQNKKDFYFKFEKNNKFSAYFLNKQEYGTWEIDSARTILSLDVTDPENGEDKVFDIVEMTQNYISVEWFAHKRISHIKLKREGSQ